MIMLVFTNLFFKFLFFLLIALYAVFPTYSLPVMMKSRNQPPLWYSSAIIAKIEYGPMHKWKWPNNNWDTIMKISIIIIISSSHQKTLLKTINAWLAPACFSVVVSFDPKYTCLLTFFISLLFFIINILPSHGAVIIRRRKLLKVNGKERRHFLLLTFYLQAKSGV